MKRLVVVYHIGDGYTYSTDVVVPLEYESEEKFIVDFDEWLDSVLQKAGGDMHPLFTVGTHNFKSYEFIYKHDGKYYKDLPEIYTLETWFEETSSTR